jgi:alginate O-acetyltransferase complex protein AlgI
MFPRLVAGPIVRYVDLEEQLHQEHRSLDAARIAEAIHFFAFGLAKKVLIADFIATRLVDPLFTSHEAHGFFAAWAAALGYTAQLYFDFSGYSDMAVGLGYLVGFRLPRNFNLPYRAATISDFWRRWHISLSTWLRDYLYIPLGGNRGSPARTRLNLFLTMLLGGLWHGANWTFVLWGAWHGLALLVDHATAKRRSLPISVEHLLTMLVVVVGWVMFRADNVQSALQVYRGMLGLSGFDVGFLTAHLVPMVFLTGALVLSVMPDTEDFRLPVRPAVAVALAAVFAVCLSRLTLPSPFLYFQF